MPSLAPGSRVVLAVNGWSADSGMAVFRISDQIVTGLDQPVYVREAGPMALQFADGRAQLTHAYGALTAVSALDCGPGRLCFDLDRNGVTDRVRVSNANSWGLNVDYTGGLCAEIVAPIALSGTASVLDARDQAWMRVWTP